MGNLIVCIDDDDLVLDSLERELFEFVSNDYILEFAQSAKEALDVINELVFREKHELALVITDHIMPGMRGDELLIHLHKIFPESLKILLTGQADMNSIAKIINRANLYRYVQKPWYESDLKITIKEAIKSFEREKELQAEQKELEVLVDTRTKELIALNEKLKSYIEIVDNNVLILTSDFDGNIMSISNAFLKHLNLKDKSSVDNYRDLLYDKSIFNEIVFAIKGGTCFKDEVKGVKKDSMFWADVSVSKYLDIETNTHGFMAIYNDITDKKIIEELSITDELTKIYNKRYFNQIIKNEISKAKKNSLDFGFLIFDIDFFKQYNDTYGHHAGDEALSKIGLLLNRISSKYGCYSFRLGGEEFGIISTKFNFIDFNELAKDIKDSIENLSIPHIKNLVSDNITASVGLFHSKLDIHIDENYIYKEADEALYRAKNEGRNKIVSA